MSDPEKKYGEKVLMYKGYPVFGKQSMPSFDRVPKEYKENEACFIFVNSGEFSVRSQQEVMGLNHDTALLAKCLNYFFETDQAQKKNNEVIEVIGIVLFPSLVEDIFDYNIPPTSYKLDFNLTQVVVDKLLENFRQSIDILIENPELADENMIKTKLKEFVLLMTKSHNAPSEMDFLAALFRPNEVEFKSIIQNNLFSNLTMEELASLCHLSLSSFKRKFSSVYNTSPKKYIAIKKVERAAEMLRSPETRISGIAYEVGFDSPTTFNRNFLAVFGKSPSQYRSELK